MVVGAATEYEAGDVGPKIFVSYLIGRGKAACCCCWDGKGVGVGVNCHQCITLWPISPATYQHITSHFFNGLSINHLFINYEFMNLHFIDALALTIPTLLLESDTTSNI